MTCTWTTPPWGRPPISPRAWSRWPCRVHPDHSASLGLVEGFVQVKALGAMPVRGLRDP